jgi:hypothetical protein
MARIVKSDKGTPASWIFTIARNLRINRLQREGVWRELSNEQADAIPSEDAAPDERVAERQRQVRGQAVAPGIGQRRLRLSPGARGDLRLFKLAAGARGMAGRSSRFCSMGQSLTTRAATTLALRIAPAFVLHGAGDPAHRL